ARLGGGDRTGAQARAAATLRLGAGDPRGAGGRDREARHPRTPGCATERDALTMNLVIVGASNRERMESAVAEFEAAGYARIEELAGLRDADLVLGVSDGGAELLREADRRAIKSVLAHHGGSDGHPAGTFERAHHRIEAGQRRELAEHLHGRSRPLVTCLAFAYKNGAPSDRAVR